MGGKYIDPETSGNLTDELRVKKVRVFRLSPEDDDIEAEELEKLINSSKVQVTKIETQFDKIGNYLVAVWYILDKNG